MDPLTHTLVGLSLAQTGLGDRSRYAAPALVIGANLPDIDAASYFLTTSDHSLWLRRGWTHGIPALVALPFLLWAAFIAWDRLKAPSRPQATLSSPWLLGCAILSVWTHPTLDWLNNYGMRWWMPLDGTWYYGDAAFILDPWMWLILGGAYALSSPRSRFKAYLFAMLALIATGMLFTLVQGLLTAKLAWLALALAALVVRAKKQASGDGKSRRLGRAAMGLFCAYLSGLLLIEGAARAQSQSRLTSRGLVVNELMVGPNPFTPFEKTLVAVTPDGYRYGVWRFHPLTMSATVELSERRLPLLSTDKEIQEAWSRPEIRGFRNWARFPTAEIHRRNGRTIVQFYDVRYARSPGRGFGSSSVELD